MALVLHGVGRPPSLTPCWLGLLASGAGQSGEVGGGSPASLSPHPIPAQAQWGWRGCVSVPGRGGRAGLCGCIRCSSRPGWGWGAHLPGAWSGSDGAGGCSESSARGVRAFQAAVPGSEVRGLQQAGPWAPMGRALAEVCPPQVPTPALFCSALGALLSGNALRREEGC